MKKRNIGTGPVAAQRGITLIALIITIIVMMILVGVTVTFTIGENGILSQAKEAKFKQEVGQIIEFVEMEKVSIIAKNKGVEPQHYSNEQIDQLTQSIPQKLKEKYINNDKIYVGADGDLYYNSDKVEAKEADWLNELGIEAGEASGEVFENDFEITDISKEYINSPYDTSKIAKVKLKIVTDITTKFGCPIYTKDTALPVVVAEMKSRGRIDENIEINTLEELNVILYNKEITNSSSDIFGAPEANVFYTKDKVDSEDKSIEEIINQFCDLQVLPQEYKNPTAEMFYEVLEGQKIEEKATNLYYYNPKNVTVKIGEGEELIEVETIGAYFVSNYYNVLFYVTANGKYTVELELDGKKSRDTIEVTEIYVEKTEEELLQIAIQEAIQDLYDNDTKKVDLNTLENKLSENHTTYLNSTGNILKVTNNNVDTEFVVTEQGRIEKVKLTTEEVLKKLKIEQVEGKYDGEWEVIGADGDKLKYVSRIGVTNCILGDRDPKAKEAIPVVSETDTTPTERMNRAIWSYNNAITTLNTAAEEATGIAGARSVTLEDVYSVIDEENINKGTNFGVDYKYYHVNNVDAPKMQYQIGVDDKGNKIWSTEQNTTSKVFAHTFIKENGDIYVLDAERKEIIVNNNNFSGTVFNSEQSKKLVALELPVKEFWLASKYQYCGNDGVYYGLYSMDSVLKHFQIETTQDVLFKSDGVGNWAEKKVVAIISL